MSPRPGSEAAFAATFSPAEPAAPGEKVVVGLSGGVDSAVVAYRLAERGCDVIAVTTRNFCLGDERFERAESVRSCCSQEAIEASAELSAELGLNHTVLDVSDEFGRIVVDDFVSEYRAGHTPSPCVRCNTQVRFPQLLAFARRVGARRVASGHYARLLRHRSGEFFVARGRDAKKDQSYFLFRLPSSELASMLMPLGEMLKEEVRDVARRHGLPVAEVPDSQELCFVPDGDRAPLLARGASEGDVVDLEGNVLGRHPGIEFFTPGQRRGLGLGGGQARFVVSLDGRTNRVVVGGEEHLRCRRFRCDQVVLRDPAPGTTGVVARTRYRHPGVGVLRFGSSGREKPLLGVWPEDSSLDVQLAEPDRAPAPGQAVAFDRAGVVIGGGRLAAVEDPQPDGHEVD